MIVTQTSNYSKYENYEVLEVLGDTVLKMLISDYIILNF